MPFYYNQVQHVRYPLSFVGMADVIVLFCCFSVSSDMQHQMHDHCVPLVFLIVPFCTSVHDLSLRLRQPNRFVFSLRTLFAQLLCSLRRSSVSSIYHATLSAT